MKQCKQCLFYNKKEDMAIRKKIGGEQTYHYCAYFYYSHGDRIPTDILNGEKECTEYLDKNPFDKLPKY